MSAIEGFYDISLSLSITDIASKAVRKRKTKWNRILTLIAVLPLGTYGGKIGTSSCVSVSQNFSPCATALETFSSSSWHQQRHRNRVTVSIIIQLQIIGLLRWSIFLLECTNLPDLCVFLSVASRCLRGRVCSWCQALFFVLPVKKRKYGRHLQNYVLHKSRHLSFLPSSPLLSSPPLPSAPLPSPPLPSPPSSLPPHRRRKVLMVGGAPMMVHA